MNEVPGRGGSDICVPSCTITIVVQTFNNLTTVTKDIKLPHFQKKRLANKHMHRTDLT